MEPVRKKPSWVEKQDEGSRRFGENLHCLALALLD
jgi:hypothetical protein